MRNLTHLGEWNLTHLGVYAAAPPTRARVVDRPPPAIADKRKASRAPRTAIVPGASRGAALDLLIPYEGELVCPLLFAMAQLLVGETSIISRGTIVARVGGCGSLENSHSHVAQGRGGERRQQGSGEKEAGHLEREVGLEVERRGVDKGGGNAQSGGSSL